MNPKYVYQALFVSVLCSLLVPFSASAQGNCEAVTLEQFFECYGGKSAFSTHSVNALTTYIQAEDAISAGQYGQAKSLLDSLFKKYPVGDNIWWQVWNAPNGSNVGSPNGYYGLRMMQDIIAYGLNPNPNVAVKKVNMNVVVVGCSKGIQPTTKAELQNGTGTLVTHALNPKVKENDYRIVKQSMQLFTRYVKAITNGALDLHIGFIELDTFCLPVNVSTTKPYVASGDYGSVLNALTKAARDTTDWFLITYPSHVPEQPVFDDESFITGGMGADGKGGPVFIADDKWVVRKPAHLGKGNYTDIERRLYLPQWLQHEFFHHLYRIYPELKLEVNGHDWFDRKFWASDFIGQFETDYYSETLHKRLQRDCVPLARKLITRVGDAKPEYKALDMSELLGAYSLDNVQNTWHEATIIEENGKYYWKNKANVRWQVTPNFAEGKLATGADCPYKGQDFFIELYQSTEGDNYPAAVSLKFGGESYKKRFGLMRGTIPVEISMGTYKRVPTTKPEHEGIIGKSGGKLFWNNGGTTSWMLLPNATEESLLNTNPVPTPNERFQLVNVASPCGVYTLGFKYLDYYYWKPKRSPDDESPRVVKRISDMELQQGFGTHSISLREVFEDAKGDSLLLFVTSSDTTVAKARIENQTLQLSERGEGTTTLYVMSLDKNGGLAVDEVDIRVKKSTSGMSGEGSTPSLTVSPTPTNGIVTVSGYSQSCRLKIASVTGYEEAVPHTGDESVSVNLRHLPAGVYFVICTDMVSGVVRSEKILYMP